MKEYLDNNKNFSIAFFVAFVAITIVKCHDMDSNFIATLSIPVFILSIISALINIFEQLFEYHLDFSDYLFEEYNDVFLDDTWRAVDLVEQVDHEGIKKAFQYAKKIKCNQARLIKDTIERLFDKSVASVLKKLYKIFVFFYYADITAIIICFFLKDEAINFAINHSINDFTLWSIVIILFQLLIKESLVETLYYKVYRYLITRLARRFINNDNGEYDDSLLNIDKYD